ncbi:FAD/NAD(P)-binding domain-containing protein [Hypoxylon sp. FL1857]|nr:FAD/NAD(P)-binding domain-containing protein [Hypoxylon sp. FL1857]
MYLKSLWATSLALYCFPRLVGAAENVDFNTDPPFADTIYRDVVVIGGGSSGTYTAVRLRDYGKTVAVVERKGKLGGHAETYVDPNTGYAINIGVAVFAQLKVVTDYFARFNIPLTTISSFGTSEYVDFSTGRAVDFTPPSEEAFNAALTAYSAQLEKYPAIQGSFNLTYPVEEDLLMSFGEFALKYNLGDMVPETFLTNQGYVPLLNISMLYIFKYLNAEQINSFKQGYLTTVHHDTQELYEKATTFLGSDVLLNSTVQSVDRSGAGPVQVSVQTPTGRKLIVAKKIVFTAPPLLSNLGGYDLSDDEKTLFSQFSANGYYTGLLNNTGFNVSMFAAGPNQQYEVPKLPGPYTFNINQGLTQVFYGGPIVYLEDDVKADILETVRRVREARGIPTDTYPEWLAFSSHSPFNLMVSNEAIKGGFYEKLFALQGQRNTYYSGAAWHTQDSSVLWQFTEDYILPILLASL